MSLWAEKKNNNKTCSPQKRTNIKPTKNQRASFYTCQKGSYTLEAAILLPLLAMYLVTVLSFFFLLQVQYEVEEALHYAGRKTAVESSIVDSEEGLFLSAETYFLYALENKPLVEQWVKHGVLGIGLWTSQLDQEEMILRAEYVVKLPISIGNWGEIKLINQNVFRKWTRSKKETVEDGYVYVTQYGEVYHKTLSCRSIGLSVKEASLEQMDSLRGKGGQKYYECSRCQWQENRKERVYYTDYGTLYHKDIGCSAIKRVVEKIKLEEAGLRRPCKYCYES